MDAPRRARIILRAAMNDDALSTRPAPPRPAAAHIELRLYRAGEPIEPVRGLLREYAAALGIDLAFQGFDTEIATLPGAYVAPDGALRLATVDGALAGCGAIRRLTVAGEVDAAEMKRLFVRPAYRGLRLGRRIAEALLDDARGLGYASVRLDTLASMVAARRLYAELGFVETSPYYASPLAGTRYLMRRWPTVGPTST